jgi:hypothetical protein
LWLPCGRGGSIPTSGKSTYERLSPILFCTVNYTYIRSSDTKVLLARGGWIPPPTAGNRVKIAASQTTDTKSIKINNLIVRKRELLLIAQYSKWAVKRSIVDIAVIV